MSFLDTSVSSTEVTHAFGLESTLPDLLGDEDLFRPTVEPSPAAHSGAFADAILLYTLLWDLAKTAVPALTLADWTGVSFSNERDIMNVVLSVILAPRRSIP